MPVANIKPVNAKPKRQRKRKVIATDAESGKAFPFEKLPPELRNHVYGYLLTRDKPVQLGIQDVHSPKLHSRGVCARVKAGAFLGKHGASILRTSREIYHEAVSILYGANPFEFTYSTTLLLFVQGSPRGVAHLTHVILRTWDHKKADQTIKALAGAEKLQHLTIKLARIGYRFSSAAAKFEGGLRTFVRLGETAEARRKRFNIISVKALEGRGEDVRAKQCEGVVDELEKRFIADGTLEPLKRTF